MQIQLTRHIGDIQDPHGSQGDQGRVGIVPILRLEGSLFRAKFGGVHVRSSDLMQDGRQTNRLPDTMPTHMAEVYTQELTEPDASVCRTDAESAKSFGAQID